MKVSIIGGGNMGCAIAYGAAAKAEVTVVNRRQERTDEILRAGKGVKAVTLDYSSVKDADIVLMAVKPWDMGESLHKIRSQVGGFPLKGGQVVVSVAAGISLAELHGLCGGQMAVFNAMPNIAAVVGESMTYVCASGATEQQCSRVMELFSMVGKVRMIDEGHFPTAMALCSCGTAFAFRYIRANMEGGIELGLKPAEAREGILQTLKGAVALLENTDSHPEAEIDKVTTAGGLTIKGLNEMEHAGFSSAVIRGLKATLGK